MWKSFPVGPLDDADFDFSSGKIKVLAYVRYYSVPTLQWLMWSTEEEDAEIVKSDVDKVAPALEVLAIYKLHKIIKRDKRHEEGTR